MLSDVTKAAIRTEVALYPERKSALLPSLKLAQKEKGWLATQTIAEVADLVGVPHSSAIEIASFYSMLFTEKVAPVRVEVCVQLPCALIGAEDTLKKLAGKLDMHLDGPIHKAHGHTADHKIELHSTVECYGACHRAPMCRVGDDYVEHVNSDKALDDLVTDLKKRAAAAKEVHQ